VEQNYGLAVEVADKIYLLSSGEIVWEGTPQELEQSPDVRHEYLGV
jgi:branched-chain amino acid transport system ATP-binding protein